MGLFSSKTKTQVGTVVSRVIEDEMLPNAINTGVVKAIFNEGDITDYMMEEVVASVGVRAERMYAYAKKSYTHGLPSGQRVSSIQGTAEVTTTLQTLHGAPVVIEYCHLGPPNSLHIGWQTLMESHGYSPATNQLNNLTVQKGTPVHLKDMVVVVPASQVGRFAPGSLDQWGTPARAGYTPERLSNVGIVGLQYLPSPVYADTSSNSEHVLVSYVWEAIGTIPTETGFVQGVVVYEEELTIPIVGYVDTADYFHAKYTVNGVTKYWMYRAGTGVYPVLDALVNIPRKVTGSYFPFAYFRFNKISEITNKNTESYRTSRKLVKYLGMDYDTVAEAINDNPDIADVEQAMLVMGVPANSTNKIEQRYLFDFFNGLYEEGDKTGSLMQATIRAQLGNTPTPPRSSIVIQDKRFKMALSNGGIFKKTRAGTIGAVGSYDSSFTVVQVSQEFVNSSTEEVFTQDTDKKNHYYRRQITETLYEEIQVVDLQMLYYIFEGYTATGDEDDDILLIPIDKSITDNYSIPDREILFSRSLHYVFNSRVVTKVKWYQTSLFKAILMVIAVVITVYSFGADGGALIAAIAAGNTAAISAVVWAITIKLLIGLVIGAAFKLFVKAVGVEVAIVAAVIAAAFGMFQVLMNGSIAGAPWAMELLQLSSGLANGSQAVLQDSMQDLLGEANQFSIFMEEQTRLLDKAKDLLDGNTMLSPFVIFGESPNDFYNRTVHSGNIGVLGIEAITSYVDIALTLPKLNETLGGI